METLNTSPAYRPEIDGLRAIAVLIVVLFHAGVPHMAGGYVGVDIFFVISGFLITSLIKDDLEAGRFSFLGFWERRARRILPALATVIIATLIAGWFLFLPGDYAMLGKQVMAQSAFSSNIMFYNEAGYFDVNSYLKPLLHTWSLGVEEQFYLFFPLGFYWIWSRKRERLLYYVGGAAIVSFVLCLIVLHNKPLAFYMLPFRMWELLAGSIIACLPQKSPSQKVREAVCIAGVICIVLPVFFYTAQTRFPGWTALPPCLGAAALVWANSGARTMIGRFLSWRPVVFIGLVSYSFYLWHWPVIVFARYLPFISAGPWSLLPFVLLSFMLAVLSWKYIETPFRQKKILPSRKGIYVCASMLLVFFLMAGWFVFKTGGIPKRLDPAVVKYASGMADSNPHRIKCDKVHSSLIDQDKVCQTNERSGEPSFILWGDSFADAVAPVFYTLSEQHHLNGYVATHHGCPPVINFTRKAWDEGSDCHDFNQSVFNFIVRHHIKHVFLSANWNFWIDHGKMNNGDLLSEEGLPSGFDNKSIAAIQQTVTDLIKNGVHVYYIMDVPFAGFDVPRVLAIAELYHHVAMPTLQTKKDFIESHEEDVTEVKNKVKGMTLIDPMDRMCDTDVCRVEYDGYSLYYNEGHISTHGAAYLSGLFEPYFKKGFSKP